MRILVTGAAGLLGNYVVRRLLARGDSVLAVDALVRFKLFGDARPHRAPDWIGDERVEFVEADFASPLVLSLVAQADAIVHCAGQTSHPRSYAIEETDFVVNAVGTRQLLKAFHAHGRGRFVAISTAKVYGERVKPPILEEGETRFVGRLFQDGFGNDGFDGTGDLGAVEFLGTNEHCPVGDQTVLTPFGISKLTSDLYAQHYGRKRPDGLGADVVILRPGCFSGPASMAVREQNWEPVLCQAMVRQEPFEVYGHRGKQVRCVLHADDLARAVLMCLDRAEAFHGDVFNVSGGLDNAVSILEAVDLIERLTGKRGELIFKEGRPGDWPFFVGSNEKIAYVLGWRPAISVEETFRQLCEEAQDAVRTNA